MSNNSNKKSNETSSREVVNGFRNCRDLSDIVPLYTAKGLYLKPLAKINVSVNLPQLKVPGKTISTWEVMEKIRLLIRPDEFASLKVSKSTLEFVRLEGDLTDRSRLQKVLARLEGQRLNLAGFANLLKVRAAETKDDFPNKHSWDSFFRDAKHMNELKAGERPDTVYISGLPVSWFSEDDGKTPSETLVMKIFKKWGNIRRIDVPAGDPYRSRMRLGSAIQKCTFGDGIFFDAYIQFHEYIDFVKLMDSLRGMKVLKKEGQNYLTASIKVDFDKSKHMSDSTVAQRDFERKRLIAQDNLASEKIRRKEEAETQKREEERKKEEAASEARRERRWKREEKRKRKALTVFRKQEEDKVSMKIAREEKKLIKAQRQLESIRLLDELFDRIKTKVEKKEIVFGEKDINGKKSQDNLSEKHDEGANKSTVVDDKPSEKKAKKLKKKKSKKEKKRKKKEKKTAGSSSDTDSQTDKKKIKSALGMNNFDPSYSGNRAVNSNVNFPTIYTQFPQPWFYDAAAMMFPGMNRGRGSSNRYPRGRGRGGFLDRRMNRGRQQSLHSFHPHAYNEQYYKYFANLAGVDYYESERSRSRSKSRESSQSRRRSRRRRRRRRSTSSQSRSRSRSRSNSRSRSRRRGESRSRSRSRRSSKSQKRRQRSRSNVKITRAKSTSLTPKRQTRSKSWSLPKSRERSCSWSKTVDKPKKSD